MNDQPVYEVEYVEQRSRATTFFRYLLAIPHFVVLAVWAFIAYLGVIVAWFSIVFTGRYPEGIYDFVAGLTRYATAVDAYIGLLTDVYPPFSGDTAGYPAQIRIPPRKAEYDRVKTLLRIFLLIPVAVIAYAMSLIARFGTFVAWFVIVVTGKQPRGLQDMIVLGISYQMRSIPYYLLMTEDWPSFTTPDSETLTRGGDSSGLPPAPATTAAPAAPEAPGAPRTGLSGGDPLNG